MEPRKVRVMVLFKKNIQMISKFQKSTLIAVMSDLSHILLID